MDAQQLEKAKEMKTLDISDLNEEYQAEMWRLYQFFLEQQRKENGDMSAKAW